MKNRLFILPNGETLSVYDRGLITPPVTIICCKEDTGSLKAGECYLSAIDKRDLVGTNFKFVCNIENATEINIVQHAYNALRRSEDGFNKKIERYSNNRAKGHLRFLEELRSNVWLAIYELTKDVNHHLKDDIDRGTYKKRFSSVQICWMDRLWGILAKGAKCPHCGEIHNPLN